MQKLEADFNGFSKVLDTGSCVRRQLCLGDEFLNLLISEQVHLQEEWDGSGAEGPLIFKQYHVKQILRCLHHHAFAFALLVCGHIKNEIKFLHPQNLKRKRF